MTDFSTLLSNGNAWFFIPTAILLGALHGLEPGHSKTMMAAFIVAVRGTVKQAILLGLAATFSHTAIVWLVALGGMYLGRRFRADAVEPYLQVVSAILIFSVAFWMIWRTWREQKACFNLAHHEHTHEHDETKIVDTGHGVVRVEIFEEGIPPHFRIYQEKGNHTWFPSEISIETLREDGNKQRFTFLEQDGFFQSEQEIPEPHQFHASLILGHEQHNHSYDIEYTEHHHDSTPVGEGYQDAHERAHANEIKRNFTDGQEVTTGQIIVFGLTGGLIPCPASITVLLLCLELKKMVLGVTLVLSFSIGLALTMILSGTLAALSVRQATKHWNGFGDFARKMPYLSGILMILIGCYIGYGGLLHFI